MSTLRLALQPSSAKRWMACRASPHYLAVNADRIIKTVRPYTKEGLDAHALASEILGVASSAPAGTPDMEMLGYVTQYTDHVQSQVLPNSILLVERKVPLWYQPDRNGIVDAAILGGDSLDITDLKYGEGIMVNAIENEQMAIYAKSILEEQFSMGLLDRDPNMRISMTIVQPRAKDGETRKTWNVTLAQLEEFVAPIEAVAKDILANPTNQPFAPSDDNCRFCDAEPFCTARSGSFFEALPAETAEIQVSETFTVPPVETLTKDQQVRLLKAAPTLRKFLEKLETYVEDALTADPNWTTEFKLVESNPHRKWSSEKEALTLLQPKLGLDVVMPRKLISPSAAEKALKEAKIELSTRFVNRFAEIAVKPPGQTTMVPASDKRPALNIAHDFQPITDFSADMLD